ncbi:MAG: outer membrane protein assembly factor BamD, partial [Pseudomonadota bacterium]
MGQVSSPDTLKFWGFQVVSKKPLKKPFFLSCGFLCCLFSCAGVQNTFLNSSTKFHDTAQANYEKGVKELADENFVEATTLFSYVKNKFPFSQFATLAELRIADTYFAQEKYLEAIDAYKLFIKFHPTHKNVIDGYSAYRICKSHIEQIPSDWFLVPPSCEKDQSATGEALREIVAFLEAYKTSKYVQD